MIAARNRSIVVTAALLAFAGCAPGRAPAPVAAAPPAAPPDGGFGVIVAERPLRPGAAGDGDVRGAILVRLGAAAAAAEPADPSALEFIVRTEGGRTLSVVQDNPQRLRPGERVAIRRDPRTMLLRAGTLAQAVPGG